MFTLFSARHVQVLARMPTVSLPTTVMIALSIGRQYTTNQNADGMAMRRAGECVVRGAPVQTMFRISHHASVAPKMTYAEATLSLNFGQRSRSKTTGREATMKRLCFNASAR